jgi:hypothetical protein
MKIQQFIAALLINSKCILACQYSVSESKLDGGLKEVVAGCYFQNASIVGEGTTARETYDFLNANLSMDRNFLKGEGLIQGSQFTCTYFSRSMTSGATEIVLLPVICQASGFIINHSLDKNCKVNVGLSQTFTRAITLRCFEELKSKFSGEIRCHMVLQESAALRPEKLTLTRLGRFLNLFSSKSSYPDHFNYGCLILNGDTQKFVIGDPGSLGILKRFIQNPEQYKTQAYEGELLINQKPFSIDVIFRGDQCYNRHDCGRFSLIYLMSALDGQDIRTLSRFNVYTGFKKWIEGKNGLLSFQKDHFLLKLEVEKINKELEARKERILYEYSLALESLRQRHKVIDEIEATLEDRMLKSLALTQETEAMTAKFSRYMKDLIRIDDVQKLTDIEKKSPPIRKTWMASFTTIGRKLVDSFMYFSRKD